MLRNLLSEKSSMNSRTQGELSERHMPGNGDTATLKFVSAHFHGARLSAGFQAALAVSSTKLVDLISQANHAVKRSDEGFLFILTPRFYRSGRNRVIERLLNL